MTNAEARARLGLKEDDVIYVDGVKALIEMNKRLYAACFGRSAKAEALKDIEALETLLKEER